jgi:hypothetical protein
VITYIRLSLCAFLCAGVPAGAMQTQPANVATLPDSAVAMGSLFPDLNLAQCMPAPVTKGADGKLGHPGDELRASLGLKVPEARSLVIVYGVAAHHTSKQWSIVAWRDKGARWTIQRGGEAGSGLLKKERVVFKTETKELPAEAGRALDAVLNDASVFEERPSGEQSYVGSLNSTMQIISPARRRTVCWSGRLNGKLGSIADQVVGPY